MKTISLLFTLLFLIFISPLVYAESLNISGTYESNFYNEMYAKKGITQEHKDALDNSFMAFTITNEKVILTIGKSDPIENELNYVIVKKNFILAFDKEPEMYIPMYIKGNTLFMGGQSFNKITKSKKSLKSGKPQSGTP